MTSLHPFLARLQSNPLLADGAMGTMLYAKGFPFDDCFDALNLRAPDVIADIHRAYLSSGAEMIETNTFSANRFKLAEHGLRDSVGEINRRGATLAREARAAIGAPAFIAGAIGPVGRSVAPLGRTSQEEVRAAFLEQIEALVEGGVDLLLFETFGSLSEIRQAVRAAQEVAPTLPIVACMTFGRDGSTPFGHTPGEVAEALLEAGVHVIGANCSTGPRGVQHVVQAMVEAAGPQALIAAMPNAGWPEHAAGRILYPASPEYFADAARSFAETGVRLIGGCCGTTPGHIHAMRAALDGWTSGDRPSQPTVQAARRAAASQPPAPAPQATQLARQLSEGRFVVTVEMEPPHGHDTTDLLAAAATLKAAGATMLNVADTPLARMRMSAWAAAALIQNRVGIETVLHFPTRGRNLLRVQGDLLAAHALGLRNLFVVMGDPTAIGDYPNATDSYDLVPTALMKLVKHRFNQGVDHGGSSIGAPTNFLVGCALNLTPSDIDKEVNLLRKKIEAGADFALTMPIFDAEAAVRFAEAYGGPLPIPVIAALMPLYSARNAEFLHNEVPGMVIPQEIRARIAEAPDQRAEGIAIAQETMLALRASGAIQGVYLTPPFRKYDIAAQVIGALRQERAAA